MPLFSAEFNMTPADVRALTAGELNSYLAFLQRRREALEPADG